MCRAVPVLIAMSVVFFFFSAAAPAFGQAAGDDRVSGGDRALTESELQTEPVTYELDIPYADTGNPRHRLDLYLPKNPKNSKLPVIVFFHGGGWLGGDKSEGAKKLLPFVSSGEYAGVSAGYRLSGEAQFPAQIHDAKAAIRWVRANAAKYGLDAANVGALGRNAGGHLVLLLGVTGDVPELEGDVGPYKNVSSRVQCAANFSGVSELLAIIGQPTDIDRTRADAPEALLIGGPLAENAGKARAASPVTYVSPTDAPVMTVHGTADRTVPYDQAVRLDAALKNAGLHSFLVTVKDAGHGGFGPVADVKVREFFDKFLRGKHFRIPTAAAIENRKP